MNTEIMKITITSVHFRVILRRVAQFLFFKAKIDPHSICSIIKKGYDSKSKPQNLRIGEK